MLSKVKLIFIFSTSISFYFSSQAQENISNFIKIEGTIDYELKLKNEKGISENLLNQNRKETQKIKLLKIIPTEKMVYENHLANLEMEKMGGEIDYRNGIVPFSDSQGAVDIGMKNVPVLNQGTDGTCVTFAVTAALDAKNDLGNYIDQQCTLALARGLNMNLWNGTYAKVVLNMIWKHGYVKKRNCWGAEYPSPYQVVYPQKYLEISDTRYSNNMTWIYENRGNLDSLKTAINRGYRVLLGIDLPMPNGFNIKVRNQNFNGGLWACQQGNSQNYCFNSGIGHEVIAVGYDDNQKLIKIRNSWGQRVGENGEFYMTYNYLKSMTWDQITLLNE